MYTRIGIPNEHLVTDTPKELIEPMYATGIGLVLYGIEEAENEAGKKNRPDAMPHVDGDTATSAPMPEAEAQPAPGQPTSEEPPEPEDKGSRKKKRRKRSRTKVRRNFGNSLKQYFTVSSAQCSPMTTKVG